MKINKLLTLLALICLTTLLSCQSVKEGISGQKTKGGDEFLVQKKNPLVKPTDFNKLPTPSQKKEKVSITNENEDNIEDLIQVENQELSSDNSDTSSLEKSILEKINEN